MREQHNNMETENIFKGNLAESGAYREQQPVFNSGHPDSTHIQEDHNVTLPWNVRL